jgi:hypothetical protein
MTSGTSDGHDQSAALPGWIRHVRDADDEEN